MKPSSQNPAENTDAGHAWRTQPAFDEQRMSLAEVSTPSINEMAATPGATQTLYRVTYGRVGRRGGRDGSPPPAPLTVWAVTADGLAEYIAKDVRRYLLSRESEVVVDLEAMTGSVFAGFQTAGTFQIEALHTVEGGQR